MENENDGIDGSYGKCRCCLSKGNHRYITKEYTHNGAREVYIEMFLDCMNLFLLNDPRLPPLICLDCVNRLRDVRNFRKLVSTSEQQLLDLCDKDSVYIDEPATELTSIEDIKKDCEEVKAEECMIDLNAEYNMSERKDDIKTEFECEDNNINYPDMDSCNTDFEIKREIKSKVKLKTHKRNRERNRKAKKKNYDSDQDTPLSEIKLIKDKNRQKVDDSRSKQDSITDNKNLRSNITQILKHSTVLPFKNNFKTQYNCFYCNKFYITFRELKDHVEKSHADISELTIDKSLKSLQDLIVNADVSCIKCKLCDTEFKSIEHLVDHLCKTHMKVFHDTVRKPTHGILGYDLSTETLKCHICSKDFAFFKNLTVHMNEHYGLFVCYICGKKFLSEHRMKCHVPSHQENKDNTCKHCGEVFKTEASMAYHIKKEHLKSTIKCPKCPQTFPFTHYVTRLNHMAAVHGIKKPQFKCDVCGREYANSGSLGAHKRYTHKRTKELRCDICGYITVHNSVMKRHMDVHNGVKNYECEFCQKKFAKLYTLKLHVKIHLNDKRFVCSLCDAAFIQKNSLKNHVKARHPDSGIDISKL